MSNDFALYLSKQVLWQALLISAPLILTAMLSGFIISVLQAITQIQDSTLSVVPKMLGVIVVLMLCGGWMLHSLTSYAQTLLTSIPQVVL